MDDYGISFDEAVQRRHGHVTVEYVADKLGIPHPPLATEGHSFSEYGMLYQMVATVAEIQLGIVDDPYRYYRLRHILSFLLYGVALVFVYKTLRLRWPSQVWYPLLGTAILLLSPRLFAHAFFNPKDQVLLIFYVIATFTLARFLRQRTNGALAWHVLASALALNTRLPALIIVAATVCLLLWEQLTERPGNYRRLWQAVVYPAATLLLMIPLFPYLWMDTANRFTGAVSHMAAYKWSHQNLLFGDYLTATDLPAYYIPAWIAITTPIIYLFFMLGGLGRTVWGSLQVLRRRRIWINYPGQLDFVQLGLSVGPVIVVILLHSTLYNGWRHLFFVYPGLVYAAVSGFDALRNRLPRLAPVVMAVGLTVTTVNMVRMHPVQQVYFNDLVGGTNIIKRFDMDYWGSGYRELLMELAARIPEGERRRVICIDWPCVDNVRALPPEAKKKIALVYQEPWADYIVTNFVHHQEKLEIVDRQGIFAHPVVEVVRRGQVINGVYERP